MAKPPELPPSESDSRRHLVSLEADSTLNVSSFTVGPYDQHSQDEALTAALEVSWTPGLVVPVVSSFMVRRQQRIEEELLDAALADARAQGPVTEIEGFQTALHPPALGLGRVGLYLVVDNTTSITNEY